MQDHLKECDWEDRSEKRNRIHSKQYIRIGSMEDSKTPILNVDKLHEHTEHQMPLSPKNENNPIGDSANKQQITRPSCHR